MKLRVAAVYSYVLISEQNLFEAIHQIVSLVIRNISITFSMGAMECPSSMRCANLDFPLLYLKSRKCS